MQWVHDWTGWDSCTWKKGVKIICRYVFRTVLYQTKKGARGYRKVNGLDGNQMPRGSADIDVIHGWRTPVPGQELRELKHLMLYRLETTQSLANTGDIRPVLYV